MKLSNLVMIVIVMASSTSFASVKAESSLQRKDPMLMDQPVTANKASESCPMHSSKRLGGATAANYEQENRESRASGLQR